MKTVLVTGVQGQDGSILAEKYIAKGWKVVGVDQWQATGKYLNLYNVIENEDFVLETGDISQQEYVRRIMMKYKPDIVYNMAAISLVPESFKIPRRILDVNTYAVVNFLETIREYLPKTRFYQASTSEQIGDNTFGNQNTDSKMSPNSPYAVAKLASYHFVRLYRNAFGLFACNGMLWNHEGPRRGLNFVTRKISRAVARIHHGLDEKVTLGNLDANRDWGLADDFCNAMIAIMEADEPDDFAVNTGETHTIREFVENAFLNIGLSITWEGEGMDEVGKDQNGIVRVSINERYYRPVEVPYLHGDHSKIKEKLGWTPTTKFEELVKLMVNHDLKEVEYEKINS